MSIRVQQALRQSRAAPPIAARPPTRSISVPAPIGGWNARDALADMAPSDAIRLDNWFPNASYVELRRGSALHAEGLGGAVGSLMAYASGTADELFAAADGKIWDVTTSSVSEEVSGLSNDRWQHVNFGTAAGQFLLCVNGEDAMRAYDGADWTTPSITGASSADFIHINSFKRRLFFVEKESLTFWYLPVSAIAGEAAAFDLSAFCRLGGYLVAMGTWTRDGGDGMDDLAVFLTSRGEVLIYQGTNPGDANAWGLIGVFRVGAPIGRRCLLKVGPDLVIITEDGFVPLAQVIATARTDERVFLSDKITQAVNDAVRSHSGKFGWQPLLYPRGNMVIFNIPVREGQQAHQYVANTTTGAWCRFTGLDALCWELFRDEPYFGDGDGNVFRADTGDSDNDNNIQTYARTAFTYLGQRGRLKKVGHIRPNLVADGTLGLLINVNVDFEDRPPTGTPTFSESDAAAWDTVLWDEASWGGENVLTDWLGVAGVGYAFAVNMRLNAKGQRIRWNATDWLYVTGGFL